MALVVRRGSSLIAGTARRWWLADDENERERRDGDAAGEGGLAGIHGKMGHAGQGERRETRKKKGQNLYFSTLNKRW